VRRTCAHRCASWTRGARTSAHRARADAPTRVRCGARCARPGAPARAFAGGSQRAARHRNLRRAHRAHLARQQWAPAERKAGARGAPVPCLPSRSCGASTAFLLTQRDEREGRNPERCFPGAHCGPAASTRIQGRQLAGSEPGQGMTRQGATVDKGRRDGFRKLDKGRPPSAPQPGQGVIRHVHNGIGDPVGITDDYSTSQAGQLREVADPTQGAASDQLTDWRTWHRAREPTVATDRLGVRSVRQSRTAPRARHKRTSVGVARRARRRHPSAHRGRRPELRRALRRARVGTRRLVIVRSPR
jgi:hypothetical protein